MLPIALMNSITTMAMAVDFFPSALRFRFRRCLHRRPPIQRAAKMVVTFGFLKFFVPCYDILFRALGYVTGAATKFGRQTVQAPRLPNASDA